jgi:NADPH:quinone reductase-like Zn-dependent oxidoreductase
MARKYHGGDSMTNPDGRHAWLRLVPDKITSWDFRHIGARFPLQDAAAALRHVADRRALGKVVIDVR